MDELPSRNWCLSCLHISIANYDPQQDEPFQIYCAVNEDTNDPSCGQCADRKLTCEPPSLGMLGDVYDLGAILEWTAGFWSRCGNLYWNSTFRLAVCEATKELCLRFEHAEMSHRRYHMLTAIDWEDPSEEQDADIDNYRRFLVERRASLHHLTTPLNGIINRQDWLTYNPERLLRLWRGDPGFLEWSEAKTEFLDRIQRESISLYGCEVSYHGRQRLSFIEGSFPVNLQ
ncbi:uncharacterized protein N7479_010121 [Penicillium vulpinum]|uniref:Uncharacterized protein n=1 Tax=Penicillium vulpinum TaxID=29845 RepID=A0A1V6RV32_9EURO|nr:uncharacterized protein N7479_010121 [Penicillium vulpinum]KAJ5951708.1 hypothetical protein N7479_010121 [Penicillium vulpinum]OQE05645.1 hypothetical protein PENVUL_c023G07331 [Penicillium vulpinum]